MCMRLWFWPKFVKSVQEFIRIFHLRNILLFINGGHLCMVIIFFCVTLKNFLPQIWSKPGQMFIRYR